LFLEEKTREPLRLEANGGRVAINGSSLIVPISATTFRTPRPSMFFRSADDFVLTFVDADHFEIKSMEGVVTRYARAQPMALSAADLHDLDGRYESADLGSAFEIVPGNNAVAMRFENNREKSVDFTPVARDMFMARMMVVRFQRDKSGKVTGFTYDNPVAKGIQFTRSGDRKPDASTPKSEPAKSTPAPAAGAPKLDGLVGEYEMAPGRTVVVTLENGQLQGQPSGGAKRPLVYISGTTYGVGSADSPASVTFAVGADGRATSMVMKQGDRERPMNRIK
jgi:hypothetical protein